MTCPHCARPVTATDLRCRTCRTKLISWYVIAFVIVGAAALIVIMTLEAIGVEQLPKARH